MNEPLISVIIATRNEEANVANCILSIKAQTHKNLEILVVDNNSSDNTRDIARQHSVRIYNLPEHMSLAGIINFRGAQLNLGAREAKGSIIFFPDADMTFSPGLLEEAAQLMTSYDALYIPEIVIGKGFFGKLRRFERSFYNSTCLDAVRFVSTSAYRELEGFDARNIAFAPDDWDFTKRLKKKGFKLGITSGQLFHHEESLNLSTYLHKKAQYTSTFAAYSEKWKGDEDIKKQLGFSYRFLGVFTEDGKWKRLLTHPLLSAGMYFVKFLVGVIYLSKKRETPKA
jgi:glycosyltransferase involved in cell wall biosynthesis